VQPAADHAAKFYGDRPRGLGDLVAKIKEKRQQQNIRTEMQLPASLTDLCDVLVLCDEVRSISRRREQQRDGHVLWQVGEIRCRVRLQSVLSQSIAFCLVGFVRRSVAVWWGRHRAELHQFRRHLGASTCLIIIIIITTCYITLR